MQYAILIYENDADFAQRDQDNAYRANWTAYDAALRESGLVLGGSALERPGAAQTLHAGDPVPRVEDGPFADTKEQLGGFFVLEADNLDTALEWAARCPAAAYGAIEVRPIMVFETDGADEEASAVPEGGPTHALLLFDDESYESFPPEKQEAEMAQWFAYTQALIEADAMRGGDALKPGSTATTVRVRDGERRVHDGPYADSKERLGGYYLLRCEGDAEAQSWAKECPIMSRGAVEIRPIWVFEPA